MSLDTLPVAEIRNRTYRWIISGHVYTEDILRDIAFREDGFVEFHTNADFEGFTFGFSSQTADWHREANGDIVVTPADPEVGQYIFLQRA